MDVVHGVTKSQTQVSNLHITLEEEYILFHLQGVQSSEVSMLNMSSGGFHMNHSFLFYLSIYFLSGRVLFPVWKHMPFSPGSLKS